MKIRFFTFIVLLLITSCENDQQKVAHDHFERRQYGEAVKIYSGLIAKGNENAIIYHNRGRAYQELGAVAAAEQDYLTAMKFDPRSPSPCISMASLLYKQENYARALVYTGKALKLSDDIAEAYFLRARAAHQLGSTETALEAYNNAIRLNDRYGSAYLYRGALKAGMSQIAEACQDFTTAHTLGESTAAAVLQKYCQ